MAEDKKFIGLDVNGCRILTDAVCQIMDQFSEQSGEQIRFNDIEETGICFSNDQGSLILNEKENILGGFERRCSYPFFVVYRASRRDERQQLAANWFLECLGLWLTGEDVVIGDPEKSKPIIIPALSDGRKITKITRSMPYPTEPNQDGMQDWILPVVVEYEHVKED